MRFAGSRGLDLTQFVDGLDTTAMASTGINAKEYERSASHRAEGTVASAGLGAMAKIGAAEYGAASTQAQGRYAGQGNMFSGLMSGISGFAKATIPSGGGGFEYNKTPFGAGGGVVGGMGTLGPNYGIPQ